VGSVHRNATQKPPIHAKKEARSLTSFFKNGIRFLLNAALTLLPIPKLWTYAKLVGW